MKRGFKTFYEKNPSLPKVEKSKEVVYGALSRSDYLEMFKDEFRSMERSMTDNTSSSSVINMIREKILRDENQRIETIISSIENDAEEFIKSELFRIEQEKAEDDESDK